MKTIKLHELTPEAVGVEPVAPPPPPKTFIPPDPNNLTHQQALTALKSAYRQLVTNQHSVMNNKGIATRLISPVIIYLESLLTEEE